MKFVKKLSLFLLLFMVGAILYGCDMTGGGNTGDGGGTEQPEELIVEIKNLQDVYEFNTGDAFSKEILLAGVQFVDQKGNDYSENVTLAGLDAIPLNEDGTLKQSGTFNLRLSVIVDGNAVATEIFKVKVNYVAPVTDDLIINGDFESGSVDPFIRTDVDGGVSKMSVANGELHFIVEAVSWQAPFPRLDYNGVQLEDGKYYEVRFDARASVARDIHVQLGQLFDAAPWFADCLREQQYFSLTTEMASYSFRFQADATMADLSQVSLLFAHGTLPNGRPSHACDVYYDNIAIVEVEGLGDDTSAPTIPTADIALFVGNEINLNLAVTDDQDRAPVIKHNALEVIPNENGVATTAGTYQVTVEATDASGNKAVEVINVVISPAVVEGVNLLPALGSADWEVWGETWMTIGGVKEGNGYKLTLAGEATANYHQQMKVNNLPIEEGKTYTIRVVLTSSIARKVQILVQNDAWWNTHTDEIITLEAGVEYVYEKSFVAVAPAPNVLFGMMFGLIDGSVYPDSHTILISEASLALGGEVSEEPSNPDTPVVPSNEIEFGDEKGLVASGENKWVYWNDQNWVSSNVTVSTKTLVDDVLTIQYSMTGSNWFGMQLFRYDATVVPGDYTVSMKINASVACDITILGKVVSLVAGDNNVEIQATVVADAATMSMQFGVSGGAVCTGGKFIISDLAYAAPGAHEHVACSICGLCTSNKCDGAADVKCQGHAEVTTTTITFGEGGPMAAANETRWGYWNDQWWTGSNVTVSKAELVEGVLTVTYTMEGSCWHGMQLFREDKAIANGAYTVSLKINASVACEVTICGTVVSLVAGDNEVSVQFTVVETAPSFDMQFGVSGGAICTGGTFVISDLTYSAPGAPETPEQPEQPDTPVVPGDSQPIAIDAAQTKVEGAGIHIYLADKPNLAIEDFTITVVSFESTQFAGYKDQLMGATSKVHYIQGQGWLFSTISAGFPNDGDQVMVVNVTYVLDGVTYSQNLKFVSNAYVAE